MKQVFIWSAIALLALLAYSVVPSSAHPDDPVECVLAGGTWTGIQADSRGCVLPYADAGTPCTSSDQCGGACVTNNVSKLGVQGICQRETALQGCWSPIESENLECLLDDIVTTCGPEYFGHGCEQIEGELFVR